MKKSDGYNYMNWFKEIDSSYISFIYQENDKDVKVSISGDALSMIKTNKDRDELINRMLNL